MRYFLFGVILFSFSFFSGCKRVELETPTIQKGGDSESLEEDRTLPSDFKERMRHICPF